MLKSIAVLVNVRKPKEKILKTLPISMPDIGFITPSPDSHTCLTCKTLHYPWIPSFQILGRCEASWGEPERDLTVSTRLSDSVFTETHRLENALKSEDE